jgi:hypothetical protein
VLIEGKIEKSWMVLEASQKTPVGMQANLPDPNTIPAFLFGSCTLVVIDLVVTHATALLYSQSIEPG